jgi:MFS family permease
VGGVIAGVGNGIEIVAMRTALQEATPSGRMASILSLNESMFQAVPGIGIVTGGALAAAGGPRLALAAGGVGALVVASAIWMALPALDVVEAEQSEMLPPSGEAGAMGEGVPVTTPRN